MNNQSISEEWEKLFEGHCICDKYASQEDIGCIIHGIDGIKAKKFIQSKISQALAARDRELMEKVESFRKVHKTIAEQVAQDDFSYSLLSFLKEEK